MEENLTLKDLIKIFKERIFLIILITSFAVLIASGISYYLLTPTYEKSTQILVNQQKGNIASLNNLNMETDLRLINTYSVIIKSPVILDKVIEQLNLQMTAKELNKHIAVDSSEDSQVFNVTAKYQDPQIAVDMANTTAQVFQTEIQTLMDVNNVTILTPAVLEAREDPISPSPFLNMFIAAVLGLLFGSGVALLLSYLDNTLKNEEDVKKILDIPVVGIISPINEKEKASGIVPVVLNQKEV